LFDAKPFLTWGTVDPGFNTQIVPRVPNEQQPENIKQCRELPVGAKSFAECKLEGEALSSLQLWIRPNLA
jgi:hypothetical protein